MYPINQYESQKPFGLRFMLNEKEQKQMDEKFASQKPFGLRFMLNAGSLHFFGDDVWVSKAFRLAVHVEHCVKKGDLGGWVEVSKAFRLAVHVEHDRGN